MKFNKYFLKESIEYDRIKARWFRKEKQEKETPQIKIT